MHRTAAKDCQAISQVSHFFAPVIMPERGVKNTKTTCAISVVLSMKLFVGMTAETSCDIVIDASKPIDEIADLVFNAFKAKRK